MAGYEQDKVAILARSRRIEGQARGLARRSPAAVGYAKDPVCAMTDCVVDHPERHRATVAPGRRPAEGAGERAG